MKCAFCEAELWVLPTGPALPAKAGVGPRSRCHRDEAPQNFGVFGQPSLQLHIRPPPALGTLRHLHCQYVYRGGHGGH